MYQKENYETKLLPNFTESCITHNQMYLTSSLLGGFCLSNPTFPNKATGHKRLEVKQSCCMKSALTKLFAQRWKDLGEGEELLILIGEGGT